MAKKIKKKSKSPLEDARRHLKTLEIRKRRLEALLIQQKAQAGAFLERIPNHVNADHLLGLDRELACEQRGLDEMKKDLERLQQIEDSRERDPGL